MDFGRHIDIGFASKDEIALVQETLLKEHLTYCSEKSPFYKDVLSDVSVADISLEDLPSLPTTSKNDLGSDNEAFRAAPAERMVDIVLSSGTTGVPTQIMYTERDLQRLAYNEEKSFSACGVTSEDVVLLTCTMDRCFVAGLAYFLGIRNLGATAIRNGHGTMESHMAIIERMRPTVVVCVPTFMRKLGEYMQTCGSDPQSSSVKKIVCIGEPIRDENMDFVKLGTDLESMWDAHAFSTYASSETITTFCECTAQCGGHLHPDLAIVEIVDKDGCSVSTGEAGEVVVTPLAIEGMPLIRFRTGDVSFLVDEACECGRNTPRLGPIVGRMEQMMKVRGTTLYPQAVYSALDEIEGIAEYYLLVRSEDRLSDDLTVHLAVRDMGLSCDMIQQKLQARLRVKPAVVLEDEELIRQKVYPAKSRKPIRFVDEREF